MSKIFKISIVAALSGFLFGFDTLSTKIYNYTSEGQWEMAAGPSLLLVLLSLIFVYVLNKNIDLNGSK